MLTSAKKWDWSVSVSLLLAIGVSAGIALVVLWRLGDGPFEIGLSVVALLLAALFLREAVRGRRREREISRQASLLATILELSPAGVWVKDANSRYVMVNSAILQQLHFPKEEVVGRRTVDVVPPDEVQNILAWDREAFARPGVTISGEDVLHSANGEVTYTLNSRVACDIGGRLMIVGSAMDVTALRRAEAELRSAMRQREAAEAGLRQAQKMEAIGKLTGAIAHDFNNLLTSVLGNIDLALPRIPEGPTHLLLEKAEGAAQRGAKLIEHLLAFARNQHLEPRAIDLNQLVLGMKDLLSHSLGSQIEIETLLEDTIWPALADANQVEAAILNIAINARDAMPSGGRLLIRTINVAAAAATLPVELAASDFVAIMITDTGTGMSADVLAKAFEPFFTTKDFGKGSGLGLSQIYGMARQSGGMATIDSRPGEGTSVSVFLPRAREPSET
jgi:PAS domain S-box-containing protein